MRRMPFLLLFFMSMILVSHFPSEGIADDFKKLTFKQEAEKSSNSNSESRFLFRKTLDSNAMMNLWQFQDDKLQFINLRERYPEKTAEKQVQDILDLKNRTRRSHYGVTPKRYFINGVSASPLSYRLHQLNSPY